MTIGTSPPLGYTLNSALSIWRVVEIPDLWYVWLSRRVEHGNTSILHGRISHLLFQALCARTKQYSFELLIVHGKECVCTCACLSDGLSLAPVTATILVFNSN